MPSAYDRWKLFDPREDDPLDYECRHCFPFDDEFVIATCDACEGSGMTFDRDEACLDGMTFSLDPKINKAKELRKWMEPWTS